MTTPAGHMTEADYDRERQHIRDTYGDSRNEAAVRWEHALALLFYRSGWTQERLAQKEGDSRPYIARRLLFSRFLANVPNGTNTENLTEGRFRNFWKQTSAEDSERIRFREVLRLMADDTESQKRNPVREANGEQLARGYDQCRTAGRLPRPQSCRRNRPRESWLYRLRSGSLGFPASGS